jgi:hypothetical protein
VSTDRLLDLFTLMERVERQRSGGVALCEVAAEFMELDGAGIALTSDGDNLTSLCTSNPAAEALMNLELTLGEGPGFDASQGRVNEDTDLLREDAVNWSAYRPEAVALGARAVFGYPVQLGAIRFGSLSLFRHSPGPLDSGQSSDAYLVASVIVRAILTQQAGGSSQRLVGEMGEASLLDFRFHQAAGMVAVQGSSSVKGALVLLRAHAFAVGYPLTELANAVVSGATRFDPDTHEWIDEAHQSDER